MGKIKIDARRLNRDLSTKAPSWSVFQALAKEAQVFLSQDTLTRIKAGEATLASLAKLALILQTSVENYLLTGDAPRRTEHIAGEWRALYCETWPPFYEISTTRERLLIRQTGNRIKGIYEFLDNESVFEKRDSIFEMRGLVVGDFVSGCYFVRGRSSEQGLGTFQLKLLDEARFADGFCTYCSDNGMASVSPNIWIRQSETTSNFYNKNDLELVDKTQFHTRPRAA